MLLVGYNYSQQIQSNRIVFDNQPSSLPSFTISMSTKQSQLYMYFQNKAYHYQNIQTAKSRVANRLDDSMNQTINHVCQQNYNRDLPENKRYEIQVENQHMTHRLASIQTNIRKEIDVKGNYSRYNSFERKFRLKNKFEEEKQRQREIKNSKIQAKIKSMKPQIGSCRFWQSDYKQKTKMKRNIRSSKGNLLVQNKSFIAEAYLDFIHRINRDKDDKNGKDMHASRSSNAKEKAIAIERMFVLPNLTTRKVAKLKNSQVTIDIEQPSETKQEEITAKQ